MPTPFEVLWQEPQLRPLAPLVLAAWRDGHLTPAELLSIRETLERASWLSDSARQALRSWLDADAPPTPRALRTLEREVSTWLSAAPKGQRRPLSALAAALVSGNVADSQVQNALTLLASVGATFTEEELETPASAVCAAPRGAVDRLGDAERNQLRSWLDGSQAETRERVRALLSEPEFRTVQGLPTASYREQVLSWLRRVIERGAVAHCFPHGLSAGRDVGRFVATFETLAMFDLSLVVKFGVQAGLFAGAIEALGTPGHHGLLTAALEGKLIGCFAMTERGHGSNVRGLLTSARYEPDSESFVISTPGLAAGKEWIGNAAVHARTAVVFAQLETLGESYGVHAFVVPIRHEDGTPCAGVRSEDCGHKMGLNGVDNGRLWFDDVRVPRGALLDRFGQVLPDGQYQSKIPSSGKRFFTMLGTLVGGRIAVSGGAISASKVGLSIAIRYGLARTQFAGVDGHETPIFDYLTHQRRLLPPLAAAYAYTFAQAELVRRASELDAEGATRPDVETLAAGLKALSTWQAIATLQQCRESCGGQGYLTANRIDALRTDTDVFTTFEGDNTVLLSLVANNLLRAMRGLVRKRPIGTVLKSLVEDVVIALQERNPIAARADSRESLRAFELHETALRFREKALLVSLARRVSRRIDDGLSAQQAFEACQDHGVALARAHIESYVLRCFQEVARDQPLLEPLCALFGLSRIEADLAWFLENDFMAPPKSRAVRDQVNALVREIAPRALDLVDAFAIPASCLGPLADPEYLRGSGLVREET